MKWYLTAWKKYLVFDGRASRQEYWMFTLVHGLVFVSLYPISKWWASHDWDLGAVGFVLFSVYWCASRPPAINVTTRRLHDIGRSGWDQLIALIPVIGNMVLLVSLLADSQPGDNEYGPNPKIPVEPPRSAVCPFCAEEIKVAAIACKHCGRELPNN